MTHSMLFFQAAYLFLGLFHFYRMWWNRRTARPMLTFEDGTSWFQLLGRVFVVPFNLIAMPFIYLGMIFLPRKERQFPAPIWIADIRSFTNIVVDPLIII